MIRTRDAPSGNRRVGRGRLVGPSSCGARRAPGVPGVLKRRLRARPSQRRKAPARPARGIYGCGERVCRAPAVPAGRATGGRGGRSPLAGNSTDKALNLLESAAAPGYPHRLGDIAAAAGVPKAGAHRILQDCDVLTRRRTGSPRCPGHRLVRRPGSRRSR
ncbi:helix-turn-helix domain-containing protein [Streptomyces sp. NBC_00203]|uniref:helix-turn-helix domain-containing protein n=1 Tax=Streptomyces sp. NBC_00203 TaxID=2975680 RepID=UPI00386785CE